MYTKGPWTVSTEYPATEGMVILDEQGFPIADLDIEPILEGYAEKLGVDHWGRDPRATKERAVEEIEANAVLIAESPTLLAALKYIIDIADNVKGAEMKCYKQAFRNARLTIAAAEGRE